MCRLFGMLSVEPSTARKYLLEDPCSLYAQSKVDPKSLQSDGWGVGFYLNGVPRLIKSEKPVYTEYERFASAVEAARSKIILAHIRRASNPRGLPKERLISIENSQPFTYGRYIFAHNGAILIPDEVIAYLGEWGSKVRGLNDSEVYFWFLVRELEEHKATLPEAIKSFQRVLSSLWEEHRKDHPNFNRPYRGLNLVFSDGERLYAYAKYEDGKAASRSLCFKDQPALQMSYITSPDRLVVSSEKTNREDPWKPLRSGELLTGWISEGRVLTKIERV